MTKIIKPGHGLVRKGSDLNALRDAKDAAFRRAQTAAQSHAGAVAPGDETLLVCIDVSGSMADHLVHGPLAGGWFDDPDSTKMTAAKKAAIELAQACHPQVKLGLAAFHHSVESTTEPSEDRQAFRLAVEVLRPGGGTSIVNVLEFVRGRLIRSSTGLRRAVLLTDGVAEPMGNLVLQNLVQQIAREGIVVDCVAFGIDADRDLLNWIASQCRGLVKTAQTAQELVESFKQLEAGVRGLLKGG